MIWFYKSEIAMHVVTQTDRRTVHLDMYFFLPPHSFVINKPFFICLRAGLDLQWWWGSITSQSSEVMKVQKLTYLQK